MNRVHSARVLIRALILLLFAAVAFAQSDLGSISGFVKDPSGAVIQNAKVTAKNAAGLERQSATNESGYYTITNIPPGVYTIVVEAPGFKRFESTSNKLDPSSALEVGAELTLGAATETVQVSGEITPLQTESAVRQTLVTRDQIDALELNGRNPVGMAALVPGARGTNLATLNFNLFQGPQNFNGSRNPENLITYDGAPATRTRSNGTSLGAADVDSTQEIQILTASYAAEYGRTSGAQIRILTKAGGSDFHGSAYEYVRNTIFNANTWTRNHTPGLTDVAPIRYNQFGYNVGGPFYIPNKFNKDKNRYFWYWGQEWVRYRYTDTVTSGGQPGWTVPTLLMRQGNFSELLTTGPQNILGKVVTITDPGTGSPFAGNIIPASQLSQNGLGILKAYPAPNLTNFINGNRNFYTTALHPQNQRKDTLAVDINLTDAQRLQFRRNNYSFFEYQPLDGTPTETPKFFNRPNQTNSLDYVWTISPTLVNEVLLTVSLDDVYIPVDTAHFFDRTTAGINYPYIFPAGKLIPTRIPTANITGLTGLTGGPYPSHSAGPIYTATDSLTWVKAKHTFKFGFYFERSGENDNDEINVNACPTCTNNQNGQFLFNDTRPGGTGNAIANAAVGLFDSYSELGQRAYTVFRGSSYEPFAQDSWKVTNTFTLNYGVRYTVIVPYHALWGNMIVFDPSLYDPSKAVTVDPKTGFVAVGAGDRYNGMVIPGDNWPGSAKGRVPEATAGIYDYLHRGGSYPNYYSKIQWGEVQPRIGFAWNITPKTVIRAGGGRFFTRLGVSDSIFLGGNPPFQPTANVTFGSADNPGGTSTNSLPLTVTTQSRQFKNPEAWNWNFTVERQFFLNSVVSVGYVGRRGLHLQRESDINQPTPAIVAAAPAGTNLDALRPYKGYNSIRETDNVASSRYNALQVSWNRRLTNHVLFGVAYTFSKSSDDGSNQRDIIPDTYYAHNLWGPSEFDAQHVFVANFLYELPTFQGRSHLTRELLGGWQISGIFQASSGLPCSIGKSNDYAGVGQDGSLGSLSATPSCGTNLGQFWVYNGGDINYTNQFANSSADSRYWFNPYNSNGQLVFSPPAAGTFNHQSGIRDLVRLPGFNNWNLGLFKSFPINERIGLQFRAEAFDAFNHPNWGGPGIDPTNLSTFGKVTSKTDDARNLQLSLRLFF
jgi:hypothetical protein